jgi:hypothetical protein
MKSGGKQYSARNEASAFCGDGMIQMSMAMVDRCIDSFGMNFSD